MMNHFLTAAAVITTVLARTFCCESVPDDKQCGYLSTGDTLEWAGHRWLAETQSDSLKACTDSGKLELVSPSGLTLWCMTCFSGNYEISYNISVIVAGGEHDRLSDMNCFWAASDPDSPDDLFSGSYARNGRFNSYDALDLMYVGFGGNDNTTTRFRRYYSDLYGKADNKPVIGEYSDPEHLLEPGRSYHVTITVKNGRTSWAIDGEELFSYDFPEGFGSGHFGFRFLRNHVEISGFTVRTC